MSLKPYWRSLGQTDIQVSPLGFGTVKFGRNQGVKYPRNFALPDDDTALNLLSLAKDLGINLLDTAPAYGTSEERLGALLKNQRQDWVICTKVGEEFINGISQFDFSPQQFNYSIERSLKRLHTEVLDIVLVHSDGNDSGLLADKVFEPLIKLKAAGKIRAYGMSTKTVDGGTQAAAAGDCVMVTYNPEQLEEKPVIDYCLENNKGVLIKKAFASGHALVAPGENRVDTIMQLLFSEPGISSTIMGTINANHLKENVRAARTQLDSKK